MPKLSERQRLWLTIGTSAVLAGGITALVFSDRHAVQEAEEQIVGLEDRIRAADVEIAKTKDRENAVIVFREVADDELKILPQRQQIADFHQNLTTFLGQAGASFSKLPENAPKESELARGIFVTPNTVEFEADASSLLRFLNMLENDPRLVAVKGLRCKGGARRSSNSDRPPMHKVELSLETYYYSPTSVAQAQVPIANLPSRLDDPEIRTAIATFQPETRDSYTLRPASSRRDPFVDVRKDVIVEDPELVRQRFEEEEKIVLGHEKQYDAIREKLEVERALIETDDIFKADRVRREIDEMVNNLRVDVANVESVKSVTFPDLETRVDKVKGGADAVAASRRDQGKDLVITQMVAKKTRDSISDAFGKADFAEVNTLCMAWEQFVRGKAIHGEARPVLEEIKAYRGRAKVLADFQALAVHVTGVMVHSLEPARSVALVNGTVVRKGDALPGHKDVVVAAVGREGVDFLYQNERIRRPVESASGGKPVSGAAVVDTVAAPR